jgi:hypothetical protein
LVAYEQDFRETFERSYHFALQENQRLDWQVGRLLFLEAIVVIANRQSKGTQINSLSL